MLVYWDWNENLRTAWGKSINFHLVIIIIYVGIEPIIFLFISELTTLIQSAKFSEMEIFWLQFRFRITPFGVKLTPKEFNCAKRTWNRNSLL